MREINKQSYSVVELAEINCCAEGKPEKFALDSEEYYKKQLESIRDIVATSPERCKIVLICGPSSSGKTTTAHKLDDELTKIGVGADVLSMDNFFRGIANYTLNEHGKPDMEAVETLDTELLNFCLKELIETGRSYIPQFDFEKQARKEDRLLVEVKDNEVLIIEGIHALNPKVIEGIPLEKVFRIYISVRTKFVHEGTDLLRPSDVRLIRRMVRDNLFRGYSAADTVNYWQHVLDSEKKYIDPYRDDVDYKMDTILDYEVCIWNELLHDFLMINEISSHPFMEKINNALLKFSQLPANLIPQDSLLREFIG